MGEKTDFLETLVETRSPDHDFLLKHGWRFNTGGVKKKDAEGTYEHPRHRMMIVYDPKSRNHFSATEYGEDVKSHNSAEHAHEHATRSDRMGDKLKEDTNPLGGKENGPHVVWRLAEVPPDGSIVDPNWEAVHTASSKEKAEEVAAKYKGAQTLPVGIKPEAPVLKTESVVGSDGSGGKEKSDKSRDEYRSGAGAPPAISEKIPESDKFVVTKPIEITEGEVIESEDGHGVVKSVNEEEIVVEWTDLDGVVSEETVRIDELYGKGKVEKIRQGHFEAGYQAHSKGDEEGSLKHRKAMARADAIYTALDAHKTIKREKAAKAAALARSKKLKEDDQVTENDAGNSSNDGDGAHVAKKGSETPPKGSIESGNEEPSDADAEGKSNKTGAEYKNGQTKPEKIEAKPPVMAEGEVIASENGCGVITAVTEESVTVMWTSTDGLVSEEIVRIDELTGKGAIDAPGGIRHKLIDAGNKAKAAGDEEGLKKLEKKHRRLNAVADALTYHRMAKQSKADRAAALAKAKSLKENVTESFELTGDKRAIARKVRKIEGVTVETIDDKFVAVNFDASIREDVADALKESFLGEDVGMHLVKEGAGKSFVRVLSEAGFEDTHVTSLAAIFKAAVNERVSAREDAFDARVNERVETVVESLADELEAAASEFVSEWMNENKVAITSNVKLSLAEEMVGKIKTALSEAGIDLPESKLTAFDALDEENAAIKESLNNVLAERDSLVEELDALKRERVLAQVSEDSNLSFAQRERLQTMLEDHSGSIESFKEKAETVVKTFFNESVRGTREQISMTNDVISESAVVRDVRKGQSVDPYAAFLRRGGQAVPRKTSK